MDPYSNGETDLDDEDYSDAASQDAYAMPPSRVERVRAKRDDALSRIERPDPRTSEKLFDPNVSAHEALGALSADIQGRARLRGQILGQAAEAEAQAARADQAAAEKAQAAQEKAAERELRWQARYAEQQIKKSEDYLKPYEKNRASMLQQIEARQQAKKDDEATSQKRTLYFFGPPTEAAKAAAERLKDKNNYDTSQMQADLDAYDSIATDHRNNLPTLKKTAKDLTDKVDSIDRARAQAFGQIPPPSLDPTSKNVQGTASPAENATASSAPDFATSQPGGQDEQSTQQPSLPTNLVTPFSLLIAERDAIRKKPILTTEQAKEMGWAQKTPDQKKTIIEGLRITREESLKAVEKKIAELAPKEARASGIGGPGIESESFLDNLGDELHGRAKTVAATAGQTYASLGTGILDLATAAQVAAGADPNDAWTQQQSKLIKEYYTNASDPRYQDALATQLTSVLTSAHSFAAPTGIVKAAGAGATGIRIAAGVVGSLQQGGDSFAESMEMGLTKKQAFERMFVGMGAGALEAAGAAPILSKLDKMSRGSISKFLVTQTKEGLEEGGQEFLQSLTQDIADLFILGKDDPRRKSMSKIIADATEAGVWGFTAGFLYSGLVDGMQRRDFRNRANNLKTENSRLSEAAAQVNLDETNARVADAINKADEASYQGNLDYDMRGWDPAGGKFPVSDLDHPFVLQTKLSSLTTLEGSGLTTQQQQAIVAAKNEITRRLSKSQISAETVKIASELTTGTNGEMARAEADIQTAQSELTALAARNSGTFFSPTDEHEHLEVQGKLYSALQRKLSAAQGEVTPAQGGEFARILPVAKEIAAYPDAAADPQNNGRTNGSNQRLIAITVAKIALGLPVDESTANLRNAKGQKIFTLDKKSNTWSISNPDTLNQLRTNSPDLTALYESRGTRAAAAQAQQAQQAQQVASNPGSYTAVWKNTRGEIIHQSDPFDASSITDADNIARAMPPPPGIKIGDGTMLEVETITEPSAQQPAPSATSASVPIMVTKNMENELLAKGFSQEEVNKMTPQEAWRHLQQQAPVHQEQQSQTASLTPKQADLVKRITAYLRPLMTLFPGGIKVDTTTPAGNSGGVYFDPNTQSLIIHAQDAETDITSDSNLRAKLAEEAIHAILAAANVDAEGFFQALPSGLRQHVKQAYSSLEGDYQRGHETLRMFLQRKIKFSPDGSLQWVNQGGEIITEQTSPKLMGRLRDIINTLLDKLKDLRTTLRGNPNALRILDDAEKSLREAIQSLNQANKQAAQVDKQAAPQNTDTHEARTDDNDDLRQEREDADPARTITRRNAALASEVLGRVQRRFFPEGLRSPATNRIIKAFGAEIAAVADGRKPLFYENFLPTEEAADQAAATLATQFPRLHVGSFGTSVYVANLEQLTAIMENDPFQYDASDPIKSLHEAIESDEVGELLGYGVKSRHEGDSTVEILDKSGDFLAGFVANKEDMATLAARTQDYADGLGAPVRAIISPRKQSLQTQEDEFSDQSQGASEAGQPHTLSQEGSTPSPATIDQEPVPTAEELAKKLTAREWEAAQMSANELRDFFVGTHPDQEAMTHKFDSRSIYKLVQYFEAAGLKEEAAVALDEFERLEKEAMLKEVTETVKADVPDFIEEIIKRGGIPITDKVFQGEIDMARENPKARRVGLFRKNALKLDQLNISLGEIGFHFDSPADMLDAVINRLNTGKDPRWDGYISDYQPEHSRSLYSQVAQPLSPASHGKKDTFTGDLFSGAALSALADLPAAPLGGGMGAIPTGRAEAVAPQLLSNLGITDADLANLVASDKTLRNVPRATFQEAVEAGKKDVRAAIADKTSYLYNNSIPEAQVQQVQQMLAERGHNAGNVTGASLLKMMHDAQKAYATSLWDYLENNPAYSTPQKLLVFAAFTRETAVQRRDGKMQYIDLGGTSGKLPQPHNPLLIGAIAQRLAAEPYKGRLSDLVFQEGQKLADAALASKTKFDAETETGEKGQWVVFKKGGDGVDLSQLSLRTQNTPCKGWCIGAGGTAESYLKRGDMHLFVDGNGMPRAGMLVVNGRIEELRGVLQGQDLEVSMATAALAYTDHLSLDGGKWTNEAIFKTKANESISRAETFNEAKKALTKLAEEHGYKNTTEAPEDLPADVIALPRYNSKTAYGDASINFKGLDRLLKGKKVLIKIGDQLPEGAVGLIADGTNFYEDGEYDTIEGNVYVHSGSVKIKRITGDAYVFDGTLTIEVAERNAKSYSHGALTAEMVLGDAVSNHSGTMNAGAVAGDAYSDGASTMNVETVKGNANSDGASTMNVETVKANANSRGASTMNVETVNGGVRSHDTSTMNVETVNGNANSRGASTMNVETVKANANSRGASTLNVETVKGRTVSYDNSTMNQNVPFHRTALEKALGGIKGRSLQGESLGVLSKDERDFAGRAEANRRRVLQEPGEARRAGVDVGDAAQKRFAKARKDFAQAGAKIQETSQTALAGIYPQADGDIIFAVNPKAGLRAALWSGNNPNATSRFVEDTLSEEWFHLGHALALRERWEANGKQGAFDAYFEKENRRAFDSISPAVAKLSARNRQEVESALVSSARLYFSEAIPALERDGLTWAETAQALTEADAYNDVAFVAELLRQMDQLQSQNNITETGFAGMLARLKAWVSRALDALRKLAGQVKDGTLGNKIRTLAGEIEEKLREMGTRPTALFSQGTAKQDAAEEAAATADAEKDFESLSPEAQARLRRVAAQQFADVEQANSEVLRAHDEEGKPLPAPNGQPSKLNRRQWIQVRTPLFKRWFGDWEGLANGDKGVDPDSVSKVVDANGEPLVVNVLTSQNPSISSIQWKQVKKYLDSIHKLSIALSNYDKRSFDDRLIRADVIPAVYIAGKEVGFYADEDGKVVFVYAYMAKHEIVSMVRSKEHDNNPLSPFYYRATNDINEPSIASEIVSKNHRDDYFEKGMSVADHDSYAVNYRYHYAVIGDVVGVGSDGEPVLKDAIALTRAIRGTKPLPSLFTEDSRRRSASVADEDYHALSKKLNPYIVYEPKGVLTPILLTDRSVRQDGSQWNQVFISPARKQIKSATSNEGMFSQGGNILYSQSTQKENGLSREAVAEQVAREYGIREGGAFRVVSGIGATTIKRAIMTRSLDSAIQSGDDLTDYFGEPGRLTERTLYSKGQSPENWEGRSVFDTQGNLLRIELNADNLHSPEDVRRVMEHELGHAASEKGTLRNAISKIREAEREEIAADMERLGYDAADTKEADARAVDALREAWKGRTWFQRTVAHIYALAKKAGLNLSEEKLRLLAERAAVRAVAAEIRKLAARGEQERSIFRQMLISLPKADRARVLTLDGGGYLVPPDVNARLRADSRFALTAYHGTPHEVSGGFSTKRIGSGEGSQAYGWGLYFAQLPSTAEGHKGTSARTRDGRIASKIQPWFNTRNNPIDIASKALYSISRDPLVAVNAIQEDLHRMSEGGGIGWKYFDPSDFTEENLRAAIGILESGSIQISEGNLYAVELDVEEDDLLDWDKPLSEQSEKVRSALDANPDAISTGEDVYNDIISSFGNARDASLHLLGLGIPGIRYLDGNSRVSAGEILAAKRSIESWRGKDADQLRYAEQHLADLERKQHNGTSNYVIFDESKIRITHRNGQPVTATEGNEIIQHSLASQPASRQQQDATVDEQAIRQYFEKNGTPKNRVREESERISRTIQLNSRGILGETGSSPYQAVLPGFDAGGEGERLTKPGEAAAQRAVLDTQAYADSKAQGLASPDLLSGLKGDWQALAREIDAKGRASSILADLVNDRIPAWDITGTKIETPEDVLAVMQPIRSPYFESLKVMVLDGNNNVAHSQILFVGSLNESIADPKRVFAVLARLREKTGKNYKSLVISHNHPSGDPTPSPGDRSIQQRFNAVALAAGWNVMDHVITNGETYYSFRENHLATPGESAGYKPRKDTGIRPTMPPKHKRLAEWEVLPRSELQRADQPNLIAEIAKSLRSGNQETAHLFYLSTRLTLLGLERINLADLTNPKRFTQIALTGAAREGASGLVIEVSSEHESYKSGMQRAQKIKTIWREAGLNLFDFIITNTQESTYKSAKQDGWLEMYGGTFTNHASALGEQVEILASQATTADDRARAAGQLLLDFDATPDGQARAIESRQAAEDRAAPTKDQNALITANLGLAGWFANRYRNILGMEYEDLRGEAILALVRAAKSYDPSKGPFAAYAGTAMKNQMLARQNYQIKRAKLSSESLDETISEDDDTATRKDTIATPEGRPQPEADGMAILGDLITRLPAREQSILRDLASGDDWRTIGARHKLSHEGARRAATKAAEWLRRNLAERGITSADDIIPQPSPDSDPDGIMLYSQPSQRMIEPSDYPATMDIAHFSTNVASIEKHPLFQAAKERGDAKSGADLVIALFNPEKYRPLIESLDRTRPIYIVPIRARETKRGNMIPIMFARRLAQEIGGNARVWNAIHKRPGAHNTGATADIRTRSVQKFKGKLPPAGAQIIVADDTFTSGNTLTGLVDYLAQDGHMPIAAATLAAGRYQNWLKPPLQKIQALLDKAGLSEQDFQHELGFPTSTLTGSEAQAYILNGGKGRLGLLRRFAPQGIRQSGSLRGQEIRNQERGLIRSQAAPTGHAQPLDEPVATPDGLTTMGDLHPQSAIAAPRGRNARVISLHPQGIQPTYRITLDGGATTRATPDHLWIIQINGRLRLANTDEIIALHQRGHKVLLPTRK